MDDLAAVTAQIVADLQAAGIPATADNRDLNPPGVYVAAPTLAWDRLAGYSLAYDLYAAVPNMGRLDALTQLGPLVEQVRGVWASDHAYPVDLIVPDRTDPLPAYRLPITVHVKE